MFPESSVQVPITDARVTLEFGEHMFKCTAPRGYIVGAVSQYSDFATGRTTGIRFPAGAKMGLFHFATASRTALGRTRPV
jgi:hypothetical protein